jgi:two-component system chemotaxis response regulator CheB
VIIVLHHAKGVGEILAERFQWFCSLPVSEAKDKESILPCHVYVAPADYHLLVEADHFALSADAPVSYARPSIDVLFESAAEAFAYPGAVPSSFHPSLCAGISRPKAAQSFQPQSAIGNPQLIGLILTGASDDGARGLAAIKAAGGRVAVQDPAAAESRVMPEAALAVTPAAAVLSLDQIAPWIVKSVERLK